MGIVSCFGRGKEAAADALAAGRSGIRIIENFDSSLLACGIAGEVPREALAGAPMQGDRFTRLALVAAAEAVEEAGLASAGIDPQRIGTLIGTGLGGCETQDAAFRRLYEQGLPRLAPTIIPYSMYNAATSAVSARWNATGPAMSTVSACASSAHAIGQAFHWIRSGLVDAVIAGGSDAPLTYSVMRAWEGMRVLAIDNEHPEAACRPFSADRKGLVLAEGAAVLILEEWDSARSRSQPILGEIVGFGLSSDAGHITDPSARGAAFAMRMALSDAGLTTEDIGYINAHGTGTRANDLTETEAIREVFGARAWGIPVSSTKSMHGHAMGASGAIEIVSSLLALGRGFIPPTINLEEPDPACDLDYVPNEARPGNAEFFLSSSFAFGGLNGVVAVRCSTDTSVCAPLPVLT
jgi:nodulation protein E